MEPRPRNSVRLFLRLVISLILFALAVWLLLNRQLVIDRIAFAQFRPPAEIAALATRSKMSEHGKFYFYASHPALHDRDEFNKSCNTLRSQETVVLGCYTAHRIFVFDVDDPKLDGIEEVTAAHEMLHAVYERLNDAEQVRIDDMVSRAATNITDETVKTLLREYDKTEPGERNNELHSILGTQVADVGPELESYYQRYFTDRKALVTLAQKYEKVFNDLKMQQTQLAAELESLATELNAESADYNRAITELNSDIVSFNKRAEAGDFSSQSQFNSERNELIARQNELRSRQESLNAKIALYNEKRKQLEAINSQAEALNRSINSNVSPVPAL